MISQLLGRDQRRPQISWIFPTSLPKRGIRIVLELKSDADVENLTNMLYKKTRLEDTFGVNMLAVADGRPETLGLKQMIDHHVDFVFEVQFQKIYNTS